MFSLFSFIYIYNNRPPINSYAIEAQFHTLTGDTSIDQSNELIQ